MVREPCFMHTQSRQHRAFESTYFSVRTIYTCTLVTIPFRKICALYSPLEFYDTTAAIGNISTALPRFFVVVEAVVFGDPAVHLDTAPLLLPEKTNKKGPCDLQWVCRIHQPEEGLEIIANRPGVGGRGREGREEVYL